MLDPAAKSRVRRSGGTPNHRLAQPRKDSHGTPRMDCPRVTHGGSGSGSRNVEIDEASQGERNRVLKGGSHLQSVVKLLTPDKSSRDQYALQFHRTVLVERGFLVGIWRNSIEDPSNQCHGDQETRVQQARLYGGVDPRRCLSREPSSLITGHSSRKRSRAGKCENPETSPPGSESEGIRRFHAPFQPQTEELGDSGDFVPKSGNRPESGAMRSW